MAQENNDSDLPVVVIGAGPAGLAAAAHLMERGLQPLVVESGDQAGAAVSQWRHIRLFSPWSELVDLAAGRLLAQQGWRRPDPAGYPTGAEWTHDYLKPLALALGQAVRFDSRVIGVSRQGRDLVVDAGRDSEPLTLQIQTTTGVERVWARAVIDASGTWGSPNPLGSDGLPAIGEAAVKRQVSYRVPDLNNLEVRNRYANKKIAVAGSGHSALTAIVALAALALEFPDTEICWLRRRGGTGSIFGGGAGDQLPARGALGRTAKIAAADGHIRSLAGFRTGAVFPVAGGQLVLESLAGDRSEPVDEIIVLTGFRPDLSFLSEIRLDLDPVLQAPRHLAPLIDPNLHSCGTVYPHGFNELTHPEPNVYLVGMKSYGRATSYLSLTGYEQVRSVVAAIAGDRESAARVELVLPETGVCGGAGAFDEPAGPDDTSHPNGSGCCDTSQMTLAR